jgi:mercuric ion binding protein
MTNRSILCTAAALVSAMLLTIAHAADRTVTLSVPGMYCEMCPVTVGKALQKVKGVEKVTARYETKQAVVTFDDAKTSAAALQKATADAGYPSTLEK